VRREEHLARRDRLEQTVLGAGGQTFGLGFFESVADFTETEGSPEPEHFMARARWSLFYGPISHLPFGDADLWEDHGTVTATYESSFTNWVLEIALRRRLLPSRDNWSIADVTAGNEGWLH